MPRKLKFKPVITRVKLNPEQAVLTCTCYMARVVQNAHTSNADGTYNLTCTIGGRTFVELTYCFSGSPAGGAYYGRAASSASS